MFIIIIIIINDATSRKSLEILQRPTDTLHFITHTHTHTHTHKHTHTQTHARTHTNTHVHTHTRTHTHAHTRTLTRTHARTHTRTHARTHARTHTHTHTHYKNAIITGDGLIGRMRRKKTTNQYAEEKRWVLSFDLKEESEEDCLTEGGRVPGHRSDVFKGSLGRIVIGWS